jgi:hypothetical protein
MLARDIFVISLFSLRHAASSSQIASPVAAFAALRCLLRRRGCFFASSA